MDDRLRRDRGRTPSLAADIATAIEDSLDAKLCAAGMEPQPRGDGEAALDRRRIFLAAAEDAVRQLGEETCS